MSESEAASSEQPRRKPRVLLAEDAASLGRLITDALIRADMDVEWVRDADSVLAAVLADPPDLLVLDDRLRNATAAELLKALSDAGAQDVPVLAMSTRAERMAGPLAELGVRECLSKPFPPRAIAARCRHILASGTADFEADTSPFVIIAEPDEGEDTGRTLHPVFALVGGALVRALEPVLDDAEQAGEVARAVLEDGLVREALPGSDAVLEGDLSAVSLVQVVQLLAAEQQTGVLAVTSGVDVAEFVFSDGRLDLGMFPPRRDDELLVHVLTAGAIIDLQTAQRRVARLDATRPIVSQALDEQVATIADLRRAVGSTTRRALFDALRWREGRFEFGPRSRLSSLATDIGLSLGIDGLLMEGSRRIEEWHVIEKRLPDPAAIFVREEARLTGAVIDSLTSEERAIIDRIDGKTPLEQILEGSDMPSYDVQSLLYRLTTLRLVRERARPVVVRP